MSNRIKYVILPTVIIFVLIQPLFIEPPTSLEDSCYPSPCGPYSQCKIIANRAVCSCLPYYIGRPPNCRPECSMNNDCVSSMACLNEKCKDPCPGSCGVHSTCTVVRHSPICQCENGYTGDPFVGCNKSKMLNMQIFSIFNKITLVSLEEETHPCSPSPCGANAVCRERNTAGSCVCLPEYFGDPYTGCKPECVINTDCPRHKACINNKCKDPCRGICGINAECIVSNHAPSCFCFQRYVGNPMVACHLPSTYNNIKQKHLSFSD